MTFKPEINPFPNDLDRRQIWDILVRRDLEAFLDVDWSQIEPDFCIDEFWSIDGSFVGHPDHWRLGFPNLECYRESWLSQAKEFEQVQFVEPTKRDFLFHSVVLRDIEIQENRAIAHKKFHGEKPKVGEGNVVFNWQTLYFLKKVDGKWKVSGFLGYLPNPM